MAHRLTAMLIAAAVVWCAVLARQGFGSSHLMARLTLGWLGLIVVQILLGAWTIWSDKAAYIATLHVLVGALALACGGLSSLVLGRARVASAGAEKTPFRQPSNPCLPGRTPARSLVT